MSYRIGVDIGGTTVGIGFVDAKANLFCKTSIPTRIDEKRLDPKELAKRIYDNTVAFMKEKGISFEDVDSMGIGIPGTVDSINGIVIYANNLEFVQVPFVSYMEEFFDLPIAIENDANVAARAEYSAGAGKNLNLNSMVMMTLGTGVGAAFINNGEVYSGCNMGAGEVGHMVIDMHGKPCNCGRRGCFENYASASALMESAVEAMERNKESLLWELCPDKNMNGEIFFEAVRRNDETAKEVFEEYMNYLSVGVLNIINSVQPDMLVVGGGISQVGDLLLGPLRRRVAELVYTKDSDVQTQIVAAKLGNEAGVLGAALLIEAI